MFIPLRTDRPLRRPTRVTHALIALNLAAFVMQMLTMPGGGGEPGWSGLVLVPGRSGWWTYLTYAFLHDPGSILHILGNMLFLWVFGPPVEDRLGRVGFAGFYVAGALLAGVAHALSTPAAVVGASGAVSAVTGAFFVLFPLTRVRTLLVFFIIGVYQVPAWFFLGLALARDLLGSVGVGSAGVAYMAHLGGYAFGAGLSLGLLAGGALKREPYDVFSIARQANRRRAFKSAAQSSRGRLARVERRDAPGGAGPRERPDPEAERAAEARSRLARAVADGRMDEAASLYEDVRTGPRVPLGRSTLYGLGMHLYEQGADARAAEVFGRLLEDYPGDREGPQVRLLLGRLKARRLGEVEAGLALIREAEAELPEGELRAFAREEIGALSGGGAPGASGTGEADAAGGEAWHARG